MESIYYVPKEIDSVPLYDKEKNEYMLFIEGEEVNIPKDLFEKIFEEYKPPEPRRILIPVGEMSDDYIDNVFSKSPSFQMGKELVKAFGFTKEQTMEQFKGDMSNYEFLSEDQKEKAIKAIEKIVDKIYEEIEKE